MVEIIETAILTKKDNYNAVIQWYGNIGYGEITIAYNDDGGYTFDTEFLSIETTLKIIQKLDLSKYETDQTTEAEKRTEA